MDEKTAEQVGVFLKMVNESLQSGKDFVLEQAPLVVQEMVMFGRVWHACCFLCGLILVAIALYITKRVWSYVAAKGYDTPPEIMLTAFPVFICLVPGIGIISSSARPLIQSIFAPRLYVLSQVSELLK